MIISTIFMFVMSVCFYYHFVTFALISSVGYTFTIYFGIIGIMYSYVNELVEPFVVGLGFAWGFGLGSFISFALPYLIDNTELYWPPAIMSMCGLLILIFSRPLFLESKGKGYAEMAKQYPNFKYRIFGF